MFDSEYEKDTWRVPIKKGFKWLNFGKVKYWSDEQWPHVIKFYNRRGFDKNSTVWFLRHHLNATVIHVNETEDEY
jgi:hypothetical protein